MKKTLLFLALLMMIVSSVYAGPSAMMEAVGLGKGKTSVTVFYSGNRQSGNYNTSSSYAGDDSNADTYLFDSGGAGLRINYGLLDNIDIYISYVNDKVKDDEFIGSLNYPGGVSTDSSKMLFGSSSSCGLKYAFIKGPLDIALYIDYESSVYRFEYGYTAWVVPPTPFITDIDHSRTSYSLGMIMSSQLNFLTPYIGVGYRSFNVEEKTQDLDIKVSGTAWTANIGFKWHIFNGLSLYIDESVENQMWSKGIDEAHHSITFDDRSGQTSSFSCGLQAVL